MSVLSAKPAGACCRENPSSQPTAGGRSCRSACTHCTFTALESEFTLGAEDRIAGGIGMDPRPDDMTPRIFDRALASVDAEEDPLEVLKNLTSTTAPGCHREEAVQLSIIVVCAILLFVVVAIAAVVWLVRKWELWYERTASSFFLRIE